MSMITHFEKISTNNRYGYGRVSSKEQAENSSLDAQKAELIKLGVPEENIYLEVGSLIKCWKVVLNSKYEALKEVFR